jgi:hypothetical protein
MSDPLADDEKPLDPAAAKIVARVRWMMLISGLTTLIAVTAVIGVIGYRLFRSEGSTPAVAEAIATLPKGARIVSTSIAENRIAVTVDVGGTLEIHTFDLQRLKPVGRLRFATEP